MPTATRRLLICLAAGLVLILAAVFADVIGYGQDEDSFGPGQIVVTVVGAALAGYGVWRLLRLRRSL